MVRKAFRRARGPVDIEKPWDGFERGREAPLRELRHQVGDRLGVGWRGEIEQIPLVAIRSDDERNLGAAALEKYVEGLPWHGALVDDGEESEEVRRAATYLDLRLAEVVHGHAADFLRIGKVDAQMRQELFGKPHPDRCVREREGIRRALGDDPMKQAIGGRRRDEVEHGSATRRLAKNGHAVWVAAESIDVRLDPGERRDLIERAGVGGRTPPFT